MAISQPASPSFLPNPAIEKKRTLIISEIAALFYKLMDIYRTQYPFKFSGDALQYSHFYDFYNKIILDCVENPLKNYKILEHYLNDLKKLFIIHQKAFIKNEFPSHELIQGPMDDKRFKSPEWQQSNYFSFLKQIYYILTKYSLKWFKSIKTLDKQSRHQLHLYIKNFLNFIAPSNFIFTNPEVIKVTFETEGENLLMGIKNYLEDLVINNGRLNVRMTDTKAFEIGKNLAITPGKIIYQNDLMQLIQYLPSTPKVYETPILFVPPWINKYYVLDLSPENSLVKWLVEQGFTVYMISWVNPGCELAMKGFSDYMLEGPLQALEVIRSTTQCPSIHTVGYCIGGTLLACALSVLAHQSVLARENDPRVCSAPSVCSATFLMTLLDFSSPGELGIFIDNTQLHSLDRIMREKGYLDGHLLEMAFNVLRPNDLIWPYFINNYLLGRPSKPFDLLYWNSDSSNLPYKMYHFYLRNLYLHNALRRPGKVKLNNIPIDLSSITIPSFFLSSETDHITLWRSVYKSALLLGGEKEFVLSGSGHVAGVINPPSKNKYYYKIYKKNKIKNENGNVKGNGEGNGNWDGDGLNGSGFGGTGFGGKLPTRSKEWLSLTQELPGSWWPYWKDWLLNLSSEQVDANNRDPLKQGISILEDAPGSYVLKKI